MDKSYVEICEEDPNGYWYTDSKTGEFVHSKTGERKPSDWTVPFE